MKKLLCVLLSLALLAGVAMALPVGAETPEDASPEEGFLYEILQGQAYLLGYVGSDTEVVIPASLGGCPVTTVCSFHNAEVTSVVFPDTVKVIDPSAFVNCEALEEVTFSEGLLSIGVSAFGGCRALKSFRIPASVSYIGISVLGLTGVTELTVEEENPYFYSEGNCIIERSTQTLLQGCNTSVIPEGVKAIRDSAFSGVAEIQEVIIPDSVTSIGDYAFFAADALTDVTLGSGLRSIGKNAFLGCAITSIRIPASVTTVGEWAFDFCNRLTDIYCDLPFRLGGWDKDWLGDCTATVHWNTDAAILGDLDADGKVGASDYLLLKRYCLDTFSLTEGQLTVADVNGDETINAFDYMLVKRHVLETYVIG